MAAHSRFLPRMSRLRKRMRPGSSVRDLPGGEHGSVPLDAPALGAGGERQIAGRGDAEGRGAREAVRQVAGDLTDHGAAGDEAVAIVDLRHGAGGEDFHCADLLDREEAEELAADLGGRIGEEVAAGDEQAAVVGMRDDDVDTGAPPAAAPSARAKTRGAILR